MGRAVAAATTVGLALVVPTTGERTVGPSANPPAIGPAFRNLTDVFPLLTQVPSWAGEMAPTVTTAPDSAERRVLALVARRGQSSLKSPIIVSTGEPSILDVADGAPIGDVGGRPGYAFGEADASQTVLVVDDGDDVALMLSGMADPEVLLEVLGGISLHATCSGNTFTVDHLPVGFDLVVEPTVQPQGVDSFGIGTATDGASDGSPSIDVVTDLSDLRFHLSRVGTPELRSIFLGGTGEQLTGWYVMPADDTVVLAWKLDPGIALVLTATRDNITAREAIQIANDVVLTDEATWSEAYDAAPVIAAAEAAG